MKFLVDNQLPAALAQYLRKRGFDCEHVFEVGLASASDLALCRYADSQERTIISKDEDFFYLASQSENKVQFVWVRLGNCRTAVLLAAFEQHWSTIESCLKAGDRIVEIR